MASIAGSKGGVIEESLEVEVETLEGEQK